MNPSVLRCSHCLIDIPEGQAIFDEIKGQKRVFCCRGCQKIYRLLSDEDLLEFYDKRKDTWVKGPPPEEKIQDLSTFISNITRKDDLSEIEIIIEGIRCASCIWLIEKFLKKIKGIEYVRINYATHRGKIRWRDGVTGIEEIITRIKSIGYLPRPFTFKGQLNELRRVQKDLLIRFGTASFFSMQLMTYSIALYAGYFQDMERGTKLLLQIIAFLLASPVIFYSGMPFLKGAVKNFGRLNFTMDTLIATGAISAYSYSIYHIFTGSEVYFDTAAMIITFVLLGRYIEAGAKSKASDVITRLMSLAPKEARLVKNTSQDSHKSEVIPITLVKEGDMIEIRPGERIPLDGIVIEGSSEIDESMLTGEPKPKLKNPGDEVFCGTQNLYGNIICKVTRTGGDTILSQIIKTVENIQSSRPPVQALTERIVELFVPSILSLSIITGIGWLIYKASLTTAVMNSISVLVIACPCALGLATPLAILTGTTRSASRGVIIKNSEAIERLKKIDTVIFDKTGTLTEGRTKLVSFKTVDIKKSEALKLAFSLEILSGHTIGEAIIEHAGPLKPYEVSEFKIIPGRGVKGKIGGRIILFGNKQFIESGRQKIKDTLTPELLTWIKTEEEKGNTAIYLSIDHEVKGIFIISDRVRKEANEAIKMLKEDGYKVRMMTGDNFSSAINIGRDTGIPEGDIMAEMTPLTKAEVIKEMQDHGVHVVMVGDGINDAPALSQAEVGISMGRATDIALESSDIVLMRDDLRLVPEVIKLSKRIYKIIRQNIFWAFIYNSIALPVAVMGVLHPIVAAISMTLSSLSVVANSMRLRRA